MVHLDVRSWHSHLAGASDPKAIVAAAACDGQEYLALTDWQTTAGNVQFAAACEAAGIKPVLGTTLLVDGAPLIILSSTRDSYGNLTDLLTATHRKREDPSLSFAQLERLHEEGKTDGLTCLTADRWGFTSTAIRERRFEAARGYVLQLHRLFGDRLFLQQTHNFRPGDSWMIRMLEELGETLHIPTVATNAVRHTTREEYTLYDALTCARLGITVSDHHLERPVNNQAYLCPHSRMEKLPFSKSALATSEVIARECTSSGFNLLAERIQAPKAKTVPPGMTPHGYLEALCHEALPRRYKPGTSDFREAGKVLHRELDIIRYLENGEFFLVVREVVQNARLHGIRCAGRGSAANSIIAYLLEITNADPIKHRLLFERFLHKGHEKTSPDIDVDFDSSRRDEVIEWMCRYYGEAHTAMVANVVTLQLKFATREMMKVLGFPEPSLAIVSRILPHFSSNGIHLYREEIAQALNIEPRATVLETLCTLVTKIYGAPRHLSLHSGGMVLARDPLRFFSPIRTSANGTRQVEFDKDDLDKLGIVKLDILGLRMLSVLSEAQDRLDLDCNIQIDVNALLEDETDEATYELIRGAQTLGIFQIESPGQMRLLAETQPSKFSDLVAQVALFRPGPLQGNMVKPYIRHCRGEDVVPEYLHPELEPILKDTYGQVIFQEQVLEIVHQFAGLSLVEAEGFRRAMSKFRFPEQMESMREGFVQGAIKTQAEHPIPVDAELANRVFETIAPFVGYGFCRSHAVAFAHTVYQSAYLKAHFPAAHFCAVLQHHPGFYPAQTLVQEARACGVQILPVDVRYSDIQYRLERVLAEGDSVEKQEVLRQWKPGQTSFEEKRSKRVPGEEGAAHFGIRLPLTVVKGLSEAAARDLVWERFMRPFTSLEDMYKRVALASDEWDALARTGALTAFARRRGVLWELGLLRRRYAQETSGQQILDLSLVTEGEVPALPPLQANDRTAWDFAMQGITSSVHPVAHYRTYLNKLKIQPLREMYYTPPGHWVRIAGVVIARQRPPTAKGFCFIELEDETGLLQVALPPKVFDEYSRVIREPGLVVEGKLEGVANHRSILGNRFKSLESVLRRPHLGGYSSHPGQMAR